VSTGPTGISGLREDVLKYSRIANIRVANVANNKRFLAEKDHLNSPNDKEWGGNNIKSGEIGREMMKDNTW
jgi:hypothetical protein